MKTAKQQVLELVDAMPDDVSQEAILARIMFQLDVLRGYEQFLAGEVAPQEDVMARIRQWLMSSGLRSQNETSARSATS